MKIPIVSTTKAACMLKQGWQRYLAYVVDKKQGDVKLEDIPTVREYPKVFCKELPSLPLARDVEFMIEVEINIAPISKPP